MAIVLLVAEISAGEPVVGPDVADRLQALGVTRISLLRDTTSLGVVLEGWAFDPAQINEATRAIFPGRDAEIRTLHEVEHVAVSARIGERRK